MKKQTGNLSRRHFLGKSAAVVASASLLPLNYGCGGGTASTNAFANPNSKSSDTKSSGPIIGVSTYSFRDIPGGFENVVNYCKEVDLNTIEVLGVDMEIFLGKPEVPFADKYPFIKTFGPAVLAYLNIQVPAEEKKLFDKYEKDLKEWRLGLSMPEMEKARTFLQEKGIDAHAGNPSMSGNSDEEVEYGFKLTKAMGAEALISEIDYDNVKRLAPFAEKYGIKLALHNHKQFAAEGFDLDAILALSPLVMLNFDVGNYYGSTGKHPNDILKKYYDRVYSIHLKDMTAPTTTPPNTNQVWGQGQTPLGDVLTLINKEQWPIFCDIELEYEIKPWSDPINEVKKCICFMKQYLG
ncbi:MAG: sugar phosphate isomerase/epimerase [Tannerellaceae bacterium]|jgi:sugar phosphate isomerase/epimerase|nr:sugar phosphate isomerase/epimerase [Tannerellaceae bacterium]